MGQDFKAGGGRIGLGSNGFDWGSIAAKGGDWASRAGDRLAQADAAVQMRLAEATPPPEMGQAPVAPARGPQRLEINWVVGVGGSRRRDGAHWRDLCQLEVMSIQAQQRHAAKAGDAPFVAPFTPGQIAVARDYRSIVEWREGSGIKCSSLEGGRVGGGQSGLYIDSFVERGRWLAQLQARIGTEVIMDVRRHMDRGNARRAITARAAVDALVLAGKDLSAILTAHGWTAKGDHRKVLRQGVCAALDRMQGYAE